MEQFILQHENITLDDNKVNVRLYPVNTDIINHIDTHKVYDNLTDAIADLTSYKSTMTPILYNNLESSIQANYYL